MNEMSKMNTFDYTFFKTQLEKFEYKNICNVCSGKFVNPVRIKVCGHYLCEECLVNNAKKEQCPKCKEHYENYEVDYHSAAKKLEKCLNEFKTFLNNEHANEVQTSISNFGQNLFVFKGKQYQLHYCDDLLTKINKMGESALHIACKKKKLDDVLTLLKEYTDINIQDFAGWAPLVCNRKKYFVVFHLQFDFSMRQ